MIELTLRFTYDPSVDAAYLYLEPTRKGSVDFTEPFDEEDALGLSGEVLIDIGHDRRLVGVEFLNASGVLPEKLMAAIGRQAGQ
jgi:uncharacterized protein YuzE